MIAALEGPIGLTECAAHPGHCAQEASCHVREPWQRINVAVRRALSAVTLADLAPHPAPDPPTALPLARAAAPGSAGLEPLRREG
jgi:DNA-binding IscR family transcriptional regulator